MKIVFKISALWVLLMFLSSAKTLPTYTKTDLMGAFNPESHDGFTAVSSRYSNQTIYMRKEAHEAFIKMAKAAAKDGISLTVVSGTRNKDRQVEIWSNKWERFKGDDVEKAEEILLYSSMPGTSRHHWGTDIDINSVEPEFFEQGAGAKTYEWLDANAHKFGYFQPYIKKGSERKKGYREEKWHWSYYPTANQLLKAYQRMVTYQDITGFPGAEYAQELNIFDRFVQGIPDLNEEYNGFFQVSKNP